MISGPRVYITAGDRVLGRVTGAGGSEEVACTAAGRALIDDADAAAQRTTLGLGTMATQSSASYLEIAGGTMNGKFYSSNGAATGNNSVSSTITPLGEVEIKNNGTGAAMMAFHRISTHAFYFGIDVDNIFKFGGWSEGANAYPLAQAKSLGFWKVAVSGEIAVTVNSVHSFAHGLTSPKFADCVLVCKTAEFGHEVNDWMSIDHFYDGGTGAGTPTLSATAAHYTLNGNIRIARRDAPSVTATLTPANWRFVWRVYGN